MSNSSISHMCSRGSIRRCNQKVPRISIASLDTLGRSLHRHSGPIRSTASLRLDITWYNRPIKLRPFDIIALQLHGITYPCTRESAAFLPYHARKILSNGIWTRGAPLERNLNVFDRGSAAESKSGPAFLRWARPGQPRLSARALSAENCWKFFGVLD